MNWKTWAHGLVGAAIGGVGSSLASLAAGADWKIAAKTAVVAGVISAGLYLKTSPLPPDEEK